MIKTQNSKQYDLEERQVANALGQLKGEFAGSAAIREEDIQKAVEQVSGVSQARSEATRPIAQEETLHNFGRIRTDEAGKPHPENLPDSVKAVKNPVDVFGSEKLLRQELDLLQI